MERRFPSHFRILIFPSLVVIQPRSYTRRMTLPIAVSMLAPWDVSSTIPYRYVPSCAEGRKGVRSS